MAAGASSGACAGLVGASGSTAASSRRSRTKTHDTSAGGLACGTASSSLKSGSCLIYEEGPVCRPCGFLELCGLGLGLRRRVAATDRLGCWLWLGVAVQVPALAVGSAAQAPLVARVSWALAPEVAQASPPSLAVLPAPPCCAVVRVDLSEARRARLACPRFRRTPGAQHVCALPVGSLPGWLAVVPARPRSCYCSSSPRCSLPTPRQPGSAGPAPPAAQRVEPRCPETPRSFPPPLVVVLGPLAPAVLPASGWGFSSLLFCPLSMRSACFCNKRVPRVFFFFHSPSFQWYSGGGLSHQARPFFRGGSSRARLPLAGSCARDLELGWSRSLLLGARATQLCPPNLATGRLGLVSPDPRPRTASCCAGPTPGRVVARCPVASSSAGLLRWFPTSSETANGLDSSLLLRPSCGTC